MGHGLVVNCHTAVPCAGRRLLVYFSCLMKRTRRVLDTREAVVAWQRSAILRLQVARLKFIIDSALQEIENAKEQLNALNKTTKNVSFTSVLLPLDGHVMSDNSVFLLHTKRLFFNTLFMSVSPSCTLWSVKKRIAVKDELR